ncbi:MAG: sulfatase [Blastocatellia bacterium]|nr:sulfatase [Blastocatellia bacterium]
MKKNIKLALLGTLLLIVSLPARTQSPKRPNILFAIADDWAYGYAGAYGSRFVKTPAFDRVAREGVLFTRAYTPNAKCAPSRAILLTGRHSWQLEEAANHIPYFPAKFKTWAEALRDNGYFAGLTAKGWAPGVARDATGKAREMAGKPFNARRLQSPTTGIENNDYAANFEDFLNAAPKDQPWSFWYGALEPHRAYEYGSGVAKGGKRPGDIDRVPGFWPDNETVRNDMLDYALEIEHFDAHLARMLASLERRGLLENTIVIVTSDHGMPFPRAKGQAYDASNHVPLAIMWKGGIRTVGRTVNDYVSFTDVAPTIIELAGLQWSRTGMAPTIGRSLTDLMFSAKSGQVNPQRDRVLVGKERHDIGRPNDVGYPIRGIHKNDWLYVRNYETDRWPAGNPETGYLNCDGGATKTTILQARRDGAEKRHWQLAFGKRPMEEMYDVRRDPDCLNNLANDPKHKAQKQRLRAQLERDLKAQGDPRMFGRGDLFDKYEYANPEQVHFHERFMRGEKLKAGWVNASDFEKEPIKD